MIKYEFNEQKLVEIVAYLLSKESVDQKNYTKLLKVLYLCEREALKKWGRPIIGDELISMSNGTLLSKTYDLIKYNKLHEDGIWPQYISPKNNYEIDILKDPGINNLSIAELKLIEEIFEQFKDYTFGDMIDYTHELPEWEDPKNKGVQVYGIDNEDVLKYLSYSLTDIHEIKSEVENLNYTKNVLMG